MFSPLFSPTFPFLQLKGKILQLCKGVFFLLLSWEYSLDVITALLGIIWGDKFGERPLPPVSALWLPLILSRVSSATAESMQLTCFGIS